MNKILLSAILILTLPLLCFAADVVQVGNDFTDHGENMKTATFTITADASGDVAIWTFLKDRELNGYYLHSAEMKSATDAAFTVIISSSLGSTLLTKTTAIGTTGEVAAPFTSGEIVRWPIYSPTKIDVTGLTSQNIVTVIVTFVKKFW